jgi:hypothetical protein
MVQREHPRVEVAVGAEVAFGRDDMVPARTHDVSLSGVRLVLSRQVKEDEPLAVSLFLTEDGVEDATVEPLTLKAIAVWSAETDEEGVYTVGCRFIAVREADKERLTSFLMRLE